MTIRVYNKHSEPHRTDWAKTVQQLLNVNKTLS